MIKVYTIDCPKCKVIELKLNEKNISYEKITDRNIMKELGMTQMPMINVDGILMDFSSTVKWLEGVN